MPVEFKTDKGKLMPHNEDMVGWVTLRMSGNSGPVSVDILFVSDGMGGHKKGDVASRIASQYFVFLVQNAISNTDGDIVGELENKLPGYMSTINSHLRKLAAKDPDSGGMGCTLTAGIVVDDKMIIAHAGDSRIYHFQDGVLRPITKDHSFVQELLDKGEITLDEAFDHPKKNKIHTALGPKEIIKPDVFVEEWKDGALLFCTDGLNDMLRDAEIQGIMAHHSEPGEQVENLVAEALEKGGHDNVSVLVARR